MFFFRLRKFPSIPSLIKIFIRNEWCFFFQIFFYYFFLSILILVNHIDFQICKQTFIPGINSTWLGGIVIVIYCWIWYPKTLFIIFEYIFIRDIDIYFCLYFFFSHNGFMLGIRVILALQNDIVKIPSFSIFWVSVGLVLCLP